MSAECLECCRATEGRTPNTKSIVCLSFSTRSKTVSRVWHISGKTKVAVNSTIIHYVMKTPYYVESLLSLPNLIK